MDDRGQAVPGRRHGFLGEIGDAVRRGRVGPVISAPLAGRAERLGLAPPGLAASQAEAFSSPIVHAGHRHAIGAELAGSWQGRPAVVFDLQLATDYGGRGDDAGGVVTGRFHVAAVAVRGTFSWWAVTRQDVREHLPPASPGVRLPGTPLLERVLILADPAARPPVPPPALDWVGRDAMVRRIGRHPLSALELAGRWALAAVRVAGLEHSDDNAAAQARRLGRPELGPWPEHSSGCSPSSPSSWRRHLTDHRRPGRAQARPGQASSPSMASRHHPKSPSGTAPSAE